MTLKKFDSSALEKPIPPVELLQLWQMLKQLTERHDELSVIRQRQTVLEAEQRHISGKLQDDLRNMKFEEAQQTLTDLSNQHTQQSQSSETWAIVNRKLSYSLQMLRTVMNELSSLSEYSESLQGLNRDFIRLQSEKDEPLPDVSVTHLWQKYQELQKTLKRLQHGLNEWLNINRRLTDMTLTNPRSWKIAIKRYDTAPNS